MAGSCLALILFSAMTAHVLMAIPGGSVFVCRTMSSGTSIEAKGVKLDLIPNSFLFELNDVVDAV
jgi:hypothetical protein